MLRHTVHNGVVCCAVSFQPNLGGKNILRGSHWRAKRKAERLFFTGRLDSAAGFLSFFSVEKMDLVSNKRFHYSSLNLLLLIAIRFYICCPDKHFYSKSILHA